MLTCQGKPVAGVQILFSPHPDKSQGREESSPGKGATAVTDADGKFVLSTYGLNDGAIVGKHTVSVMIIDDPMHPAPPGSKKGIAPCLKETREIEITPGMAEIRLALGE